MNSIVFSFKTTPFNRNHKHYCLSSKIKSFSKNHVLHCFTWELTRFNHDKSQFISIVIMFQLCFNHFFADNQKNPVMTNK